MYPNRTSISKLVQSTQGKLAQVVDTEKLITDQILRDAPSIPMQGPDEPSLLTSMAHRLRVVEAQLRAQTIDLQSKQHEIDHLKAQLNQGVVSDRSVWMVCRPSSGSSSLRKADSGHDLILERPWSHLDLYNAPFSREA
ncbi:hypothetical protein AaE_014435 [Aphanomyces astaci]|uniref:Uncharacterized protein n=1 Tax=Aphanomyces astaci TaxID=112090 RepID=A0A6A4Z6E7_APHAT|nr:hypothetical protein AaE_014435 [Aphanomyces astaci]